MKNAYPRAVIFDDTALLALGAGSAMASRLVTEANIDPTLRVFAPVVCLTAAEVARAGVAEHVGALPSIDISALDFSSAAEMGKWMRTSESEDWGAAHSAQLARPSAEWPLGRIVVTLAPERYKGTGIRILQIPDFG